MDLSTTYLGLRLKNPIVVASCGLTQTVEKIQACEQAGAGAVVMKSLFEEQIREMDSGIRDSALMHPEAMDYLQADLDLLYGPRDYIQIIQQAKAAVTIPVIASINCYTAKWWIRYAQQLEAAGADALELNIYALPFDFEKNGEAIESIYLDIIKQVREQVTIPVALKLSPYFTALGNLAVHLAKQGADGLVLFNRFVQPEININELSTSVKASFTDPVGFSTSLRWIGLLSDQVKLDLAASGGVRETADIIKLLLAGATVVQLASILYTAGLEKIKQFLDELEQWMRAKNFETIADLRGTLNQRNHPQSLAYVRAQYIKKFAGIE